MTRYVVVKLAADDEFLLIAAGEIRACARPGRRRARRWPPIACAVALPAARRRRNPKVTKSALAQVAQQPIHGQAERRDDGVMQAILREYARRRSGARPRRRAWLPDALLEHVDDLARTAPAACPPSHASARSGHFLRRRTGRRSRPHASRSCRDRPRLCRRRDGRRGSLTDTTGAPREPCRRSGGGSSSPTISRTSCARSCGRRSDEPHHPPGAHDHGAVAAIVEIVELVADQDRRHAAFLEPPHEAQQPVAFRAGGNTAVGSSRIRRRGSWKSARTSSTCWRPPTDSVETRASNRSSVPRSLATLCEARTQRLEIKNAVAQFRSAEDQILLDRQATSISLKCWWTSEMPACLASRRRTHRDRSPET